MAYYAYGLALQKTGQTQDAIVWLKKFIEMSPRETSGWEALSGCYQQLGDLQGGADHL
jgi:predicted Zn-dependent protease